MLENYNASTSKTYDDNEMLLQKNKNRFVLFPINIKIFMMNIKKPKVHFGQLVKLIYLKIAMTGKH